MFFKQFTTCCLRLLCTTTLDLLVMIFLFIHIRATLHGSLLVDRSTIQRFRARRVEHTLLSDRHHTRFSPSLFCLVLLTGET